MTAGLSAHLAPGGLDQAANLEHGPEVRVQPQLQREIDRVPCVGVQRDPVDHAAGQHASLDPHPQRLERQRLPGGEDQVRVRQLERGGGAGGVGRDEQPRRLSPYPKLVAPQMAAVVEVDTERMVLLCREAAIAQRNAERVARLDHRRVGEIDELRHAAGDPI